MSVQTKTVEVRHCDFCITTSAARQCQNCGKDACGGCGRIYSVVSEYWNPDGVLTITLSNNAVRLAAFLCHDCRDEMKTALLRLGFDDFTTSAHTIPLG